MTTIKTAIEAGRAMFKAESTFNDIVSALQGFRVVPRSITPREKPEKYAEFLSNFSAKAENLDAVRRGYLEGYIGKNGVSESYIVTNETTGAIKAAKGADTKGAKAITLTTEYAVSLDVEGFKKLRGKKDDKATIKGAVWALRNKASDAWIKQLNRYYAAATSTTLPDADNAKTGGRGAGMTLDESIAKFLDGKIKGIKSKHVMPVEVYKVACAAFLNAIRDGMSKSAADATPTK